MRTWFRAMWYITSQKNGVSALGLQRVLGLGSYRTASLMLHKVRQARAGENWGSAEFGGATCRKTLSKVLIIVAAEADGKRIGRIRMALIEDFDRKTLHRFIQDNIELGSTVCTDGLNSYRELNGYIHNRKVQNPRQGGEPLLPRVHLVISLLKRWLFGTLQGSASDKYLDDYLNEFVFRFNRRRSASRGKLFYRLAQQAINAEPATYSMLTSRRIYCLVESSAYPGS